MQLEAEQALAATRARLASGRADGTRAVEAHPAVSARRAHAPSDEGRLRLAGIYGVGKRLFAEVRSGAQAWIFLKGQPLPIGHSSQSAEYHLKELSGTCVRLERQGEETILCLPAVGRS
ncbi:MAG TPA: hypothetical protein VKZ70_02515 [Burkholderiaceae bacterium]|nr:hypothetical protein [Burkholderiaceae bacterium]